MKKEKTPEQLINMINLQANNGINHGEENLELFEQFMSVIKEWLDTLTPEDIAAMEEYSQEYENKKKLVMKKNIDNMPALPYAKLLYYTELIKQDFKMIQKIKDINDLKEHFCHYTVFLYELFIDILYEPKIKEYLRDVGEDENSKPMLDENGEGDFDQMLAQTIDYADQIQKYAVNYNDDKLRQYFASFTNRWHEMFWYMDIQMDLRDCNTHH